MLHTDLITNITKTSNLDHAVKNQMYALYNKYYSACSEELFLDDLAKKNDCVLLKDSASNIIGFTTIETYQFHLDNKKYNCIYSGDTIVEQDYWGKNTLANEWLRFAGSIKRNDPSTPLYWFLIVKGHRTYRYLKVYSKKYYPCHNHETPELIKKLLDHVAINKFKENYNPDTGIISFPSSKGHLKAEIATISEKDRQKPEVEFFLKKNPKYYRGDELACICELSDENLQKMSKFYFNKEL